jgi:type I restriction enzyme S subunit
MIAEDETIPRLRFPEFTGSVETHPLGSVTKVIDCKHRTPDYVEKGVPIVSPGTIRWGEIDLISPTKRVTESEYVSLMDHCEPQIGDMVLSRNQSLGVASRIISNDKFVLGQDTVLLQQKNGNGGIVFYRLQTSGTQAHITKLSGGSTFSRINLKDIRLLPLNLPADHAEQRKIADFLTAVDQRLTQLSQKKALLEDYKKGVMQQLFTQALRFKDDHGNDFPDWEEKTLGEVLTIGSGRDYKHLGKGNIPVYGSGGVMTYVDKSLYEGESVGIGRKGTIDKPRFLEGAFWTVDTLFYTHSFKRALPRFIYAVFQRINWKAYNEAGGVPSLSKSTIESIPISVPHPDEQIKIANFLTALDRKIESVCSQITHTQTFKKGLLQQMFV